MIRGGFAFARIFHRNDLAKVVTSGDYVDLTGEPAIAAPPQFDYSNAATTAEFAQRALGSFSGHAIQRADAAAGILQTHARTATPT
ncbi:hypothetical protein CBA19CS22_29800 [Caballeronia novacaledonica]|uniref:Uncharacterized protein n=1 Tax=Caballeronia novacaledonica TaxID=1544861 RepID=A0ACB5R1G7_9BURK|nr:hypothetical protein CBA19CS22_29800 [Caballeronia novacaledonica]